MKQISKGKFRDIYDVGDQLVMVMSDRISVSGNVLPSLVPHKGAVLNKLSAFWFDFTKEVIPNHMITVDNAQMPKYFHSSKFTDRCMLVKKLNMLPIECIVRGYITGSSWESYQKSGSICGIRLPIDLMESEQLLDPIYTPTTKSTGGHYVHISLMETSYLVGKELATKVRDKSIEIYTMCAKYARTKGIIIADTKFEFGIDENGTLVLADELLTPDSSRFWPVNGYVVGQSQQSYDKKYLSDWLKGKGWNKFLPPPEIPADVISITSRKYIESYERLTGTIF